MQRSMSGFCPRYMHSISSMCIKARHTVAATLGLTGPDFRQRFRIFLGQCGRDLEYFWDSVARKTSLRLMIVLIGMRPPTHPLAIPKEIGQLYRVGHHSGSVVNYHTVGPASISVKEIILFEE